MKKLFVLQTVLIFCQGISFAAENLTYPELQVSPRASERIQMELKQEKTNKWTNHFPIQISALSTLLAGMYSQKNQPREEYHINPEEAKWSRTVAMGVGSAWLIGTFFMANNYEPYAKAQGVIQGLPAKTNQEILTRERIAEEHIESAGQTGDRLMWTSFASNLLASAYLGGKASKDGQIFAGISGLLAAAPLIFKYNWQTVNKYHHEYKKKIYSPISMLTLTPTSAGISWLFVF